MFTLLIHTYIPHTLYPRRGRREFSDIPLAKFNRYVKLWLLYLKNCLSETIPISFCFNAKEWHWLTFILCINNPIVSNRDPGRSAGFSRLRSCKLLNVIICYRGNEKPRASLTPHKNLKRHMIYYNQTIYYYVSF
jgi:hypothetical protein